jgi:hypothetical protein
MKRTYIVIFACMAAAACIEFDSEDDTAAAAAQDVAAQPASELASPGSATAIGTGDAGLSADELERGRLDNDWRRYAAGSSAGGPSASASSAQGRSAATARDTATQRDTAGGTPSRANPSDSASMRYGGAGSAARDTVDDRWSAISPSAVNAAAVRSPISGDVSGPEVARIQILLDRAGFSPGIIDGRWGKNTEKAAYWFQRWDSVDATGTIDTATMRRLESLAGTDSLVRRYTLTSDDVSGPFKDIPDDIYAKASLDCMCYQSLEEKLAERFHTTPELLAKLNPDVDLSSVTAGTSLQIPAVLEAPSRDRGKVAEIVVSDGGHFVHGVDASGRVIYHFPTQQPFAV